MALNIGDVAPDFTLPTEQPNVTLTLSHLRGKKVVLYFYPKDNTPACTKEACDFRDAYPAFNEKDTLVYGISEDSAQTHADFKAKHDLPFTLLVDADGAVSRRYEVFTEKTVSGKTFFGIDRSTFVINEDGTLRAIWHHVKVPGHVEQVLDEVK